MPADDLFDYTYPERPGYKRPGTSQNAAAAVAPRVKSLRDQVFHILEGMWPAGETADGVAAIMGKSVLSIRPRFSELVAQKKIVAAEGVLKKNASGVLAQVWVVVRRESSSK